VTENQAAELILSLDSIFTALVAVALWLAALVVTLVWKFDRKKDRPIDLNDLIKHYQDLTEDLELMIKASEIETENLKKQLADLKREAGL
jgi:heme/copper-type cytochrome/quinol oxidase subunit 2